MLENVYKKSFWESINLCLSERKIWFELMYRAICLFCYMIVKIKGSVRVSQLWSDEVHDKGMVVRLVVISSCQSIIECMFLFFFFNNTQNAETEESESKKSEGWQCGSAICEMIQKSHFFWKKKRKSHMDFHVEVGSDQNLIIDSIF